MKWQVDVVLPCYNEAEALPLVLANLPTGYRAIVVDNNSTDGSGEIARQLGATVVHESRQGFGAAVHAGVMEAVAEHVVICDCDNSLNLGEIPAMLAALPTGHDAIVLGRRKASGRGAWPLSSRLANLALARLCRQLTGVRIHDISPLRLIPRRALLNLDIQDRRSGYPLEMLLRAVMLGYEIVEVPVTYHPRVGKSKVTGTLRGFSTAVLDMTHTFQSMKEAQKHPKAPNHL